MLCTNYKPSNQKNLFNQSCVTNIKKWLKNLSSSNNYKKILFIYGSNGCGKTSTLDLVLKNYNIYNIDQDSIRVNDVIIDLISTLPEYNSSVIQTIQKSTLLGNIILIDDNNIKNSERLICNFIENLYDIYKKNIPLIVCSSDQSFRHKFKSSYDNTFIDFNSVSHIELYTLIKNIFNDKKKHTLLTDENINNIIETSQYNLHQVYHIIEHVLSLSLEENSQLNLDNLKKDNDIDLNNRIKELYNLNKRYNFTNIYELMDVDTYVVNANIFQNYLQFYNNNNNIISHDPNYVCMDMDQLEYMSLSCDSFCNNVYDNLFETDANYTIINGMKPLYYLHEYKNKYFNSNKSDISLEHFSGFTHNFIINFNELEKFRYESFNNLNNDKNKTLILDTKCLWEYINIVNENLKIVHECLNIKKRNVKYEMYIELLKKNNVYDKYMYIINTIWCYTLFETNQNILKTKYKKENININLRIFKRLLNIFSFQSNNLKTCVENLIKDELILKIIELQNKNNLVIADNVNNMMYDLSDLWTHLKN